MTFLHEVMDALRLIVLSFGRALKKGIVDHDGIEHAGYLAYLSMLSIFPFLVLVVVALGYFGEGEVGSAFIQQLFNHLPPKAVAALKPRIEEISAGPPDGLVALSIAGAVWTASSTVEGLRTVLNRAYHVATPPAYIFRRLLSVLQLIIFASIIISGLLLMVFVPLVQLKLQQWFGWAAHMEGDVGVSDVIFSFSALIMFLVVANLYYVLPNIRQSLADVVPGACVTVALWTGAAKVYTYYLSTFNQVNLIYGSLGGIIASLIFFFIINLCLLLGAELNYQLAVAFGAKLEEKEHVEEEGSPE
jgi:membrane protein